MEKKKKKKKELVSNCLVTSEFPRKPAVSSHLTFDAVTEVTIELFLGIHGETMRAH